MKLRFFCVIILLAIFLPSCEKYPPLRVGCGEFTAEIELASDTSVKKIKVTDLNGKVSVLRPRSSVKDGGVDFEFVDLNFDGHFDIRLPASRGTYTKYACFLFDPSSGDFLPDSRLNALLSPEPDPESKTIRASYTSHIVEPATDDMPEVYIDEFGYNYFKWSENGLVEVRRESTTFYSENDIIRIAEWELNEDGHLEPVDEKWMSPEKYEEKTGEKFSIK